jgi:hypothetical protein
VRKDDHGRWRSYSIAESWWLNLQPLAGVYVVVMDGRAGYVGQSSNVRNRMSQHNIRRVGDVYVTPWGTCRTCVVKIGGTRRHGDWLMRELRLIRRLRPFGNKKHMAAA